MSIDTSLIGTTAAELMGTWADDEDGEVVAVGIVVVVDDGEGTFTRTKCSHELKFEQVGLFTEGLNTVKYGDSVED